MTTPIISFDQASKTFATKNGPLRAVDNVTLDIDEGEVFGVIGYSGAGKSTLVRLINALEQADSGSVKVTGLEVTELAEAELRKLRSGIGMIFQQFNLFPGRNVAANVGYPLKLAGWSRAERNARVAELLDFVGIGDKARAYPAQLSGGQKQRVGVARALAAGPRVLLADEATSALDPESTQDVLDLLRRVNRDLGVTVVVITHAMSVVQYLCHRVAVMDAGKVVDYGSVYDVFAGSSNPLSRRFIRTALHDRPGNGALAGLRARHPGRLLRLTLADRETGGLDLTALTAGGQVKAAIVYGAVTQVENLPFGSVTVELDGPEPAVAATLERLRLAGTKVVDLGTAAHPISEYDDFAPDAETPVGNDAPVSSAAAISEERA